MFDTPLLIKLIAAVVAILFGVDYFRALRRARSAQWANAEHRARFARAEEAYVCAWEVAQRAAGMEVPPVASFVSGMLFELGQNYGERKTLSEWLGDIVKLAPPGMKLPPIEESSVVVDRAEFVELLMRELMKPAEGVSDAA